MTIQLITIGKTDNKQLTSLIDDYIKRLGYYIKFSLDIIPDIKNSKNLKFEKNHYVYTYNKIIKHFR